ncbi:MAG: SH3 domain-containing protein [Spirochaetales bacterium]|nr:SH3 domain-containing protein [Spirochaetales bacterium]
MDGTRIERDYSRGFWEETGEEDRLTYYFKGNHSIYSEYIIEFTGIWDSFREYHDDSLLSPKLEDFDPPNGDQHISELYTMTNAELDAYPDQNDPSIRLMHLLNESMATFRFTEDPYAPPASLARVNDDRVRIREDHTLDTGILGHGNRGEEVIVMERSPEQETIGSDRDYWYKIVSKETFIKGWMFGPFLDFEE